MSAHMAERVLDLLPVDGKRLYYGQFVQTCHTRLHLSSGNAGALIAVLCTERQMAVELVGGHEFVRRLPALPDFPLVARPQRPPPRRLVPSAPRPAPTFARPKARPPMRRAA